MKRNFKFNTLATILALVMSLNSTCFASSDLHTKDQNEFSTHSDELDEAKSQHDKPWLSKKQKIFAALVLTAAAMVTYVFYVHTLADGPIPQADDQESGNNSDSDSDHSSAGLGLFDRPESPIPMDDESGPRELDLDSTSFDDLPTEPENTFTETENTTNLSDSESQATPSMSGSWLPINFDFWEYATGGYRDHNEDTAGL